jgi:hypothetical protein
MASESGKVVASTWRKGLKSSGKHMGQNLEKYPQVHGFRVRKSGSKYMGSGSGKVFASTWRQSLEKCKYIAL